MSETRIVIRVPAVESLDYVVSLLMAAEAKRIARTSRNFAVDGPTITSHQAGAIAELADMGATVKPAKVPESWTIVEVPYAEIPMDLEPGVADQWWVDRYNDMVEPL